MDYYGISNYFRVSADSELIRENRTTLNDDLQLNRSRQIGDVCAGRPCNALRVSALNGRGRRPVLAELTVIPRGCRAELSTTGRTSFKETDKSESPSRRCARAAAGPGSARTCLTYPIADESRVTKTGKRLMERPNGNQRLNLHRHMLRIIGWSANCKREVAIYWMKISSWNRQSESF